MTFDFKIIDDVIPKAYQDLIEQQLLGELVTPWYLVNDISYSTHEFGLDNPGLVNVLFENGQIKNELYPLVLPMVHMSLEKVGIPFHSQLTARTFLQLPRGTTSTANNPHVDSRIPHTVCLYYVNDSEGDTVLYDQTIDTVDIADVQTTQFTVKHRVTPRKGRVLIFNGKYYHSSSNPTNTRRCIINFDVV